MPYSLFISLFFQFAMVFIGCDTHKGSDTVDEANELKLHSILSEELNETSGLAFFNNQLFTHNDSGNKSILYALNKDNGNILARFKIGGVKNVDWEDLAQNDDYLFVGDIGNNNGDRKDLKIYKIKKDKLNNNEDQKITVDEIIEFRYSDQKDLNPNKEHNFDSEALIYFKNNLYLFTKNRSDNLCKVYKIPSKGGDHTAELIDSYNIPGLVTGAAVSPNNTKVMLTGFNKDTDCFLYSLENFKGDKFFSGEKSMITLGSYKKTGQIEGVVFEDETNIFISSEKTKNQKPKLFKLKI